MYNITNKDVIIVGVSPTKTATELTDILKKVIFDVSLQTEKEIKTIHTFEETIDKAYNKPVFLAWDIDAYLADTIAKLLNQNGFMVNALGHVSLSKPPQDLRTKKKNNTFITSSEKDKTERIIEIA
jgi:hypothetical protein